LFSPVELIGVSTGGVIVIVRAYVEEGVVVAEGGSDEAAGVNSGAGVIIVVCIGVGVTDRRLLPGDGASLSTKSEPVSVSIPAGCLSRE